MRRFMFSAGLLILPLLSPVALYAYDYPVIGEYSGVYQKVFDAIKSGKCRNMESELKALSASEGISSNIYRSICFFENNQQQDGFVALTLMLENQEYDEIIYVCNTQMEKGNTDPNLLKYRGLAFFNIGDMDGALADITAYSDKTGDDTMRYTLVDIYVAMNDYERADAELEKVTVKDDRYYIRKGKIAYRQGDFYNAIGSLRKVSTEKQDSYDQAQMLISDICMITGRFECAEESLVNVKSPDAEYMQLKREKMNQFKKPFSIYFSAIEEYDDNVKSENEDIGASGTSSFRTAFVLDAKYNMYPLWSDKAAVGLMNYRSFNMKSGLSSYDLEMHKAYVQVTKSTDRVSYTPKFTAGILSLGNEKYYETYGAELGSNIKFDGFTLNVPVKVEKRNYVSSPDPRADKDGMYYGISGEISKMFAQKYNMTFGVGVNLENTDGEDKDNRAYTVSFGTLAAVTPKVTLTFNVDYTYADFFNSAIDRMDASGLATIREDKTYNVGLKSIYRLTDSVFLSGGVTYTDADSNVPSYKYDKTVFDVSLSYAY
ncbi:outer membrane beta-barrel protein [Seleniivibrio sp.]|uniref:outer membrane beta-barrel protein n=1 Tax=Seleniivibrio sp. TaxID=2898801 RepID=UPI0025F941CC|nr:outer membrane beta-barrel protein [Seleniivibrio sp.]MCD8553259.1 outer membrane beta-barrel protein [Seleniivibrio sp.]